LVTKKERDGKESWGLPKRFQNGPFVASQENRKVSKPKKASGLIGEDVPT